MTHGSVRRAIYLPPARSAGVNRSRRCGRDDGPFQVTSGTARDTAETAFRVKTVATTRPRSRRWRSPARGSGRGGAAWFDDGADTQDGGVFDVVAE